MKQVCSRFPALMIGLVLMVPVSLIAQNEKDKAKDKKDQEQIIITRKGDSKDKVVVEIDGDKVTINGKPADEFKDGNVTIRRNKVKDVWAYADGMGGTNVFGPGHFELFNMDSNRAFLGVTTEETEGGVEIHDISKESPAAKAGLKEGDIITAIDDTKIESPDDLSGAVKKHKPGDKVTVKFLRDKKKQEIKVELGKWKGAGVFVPGQNFNFNFEDMKDLMPKVAPTPRVRSPYGQNWSWSGGGGPKIGISVQDTEDGKGVRIIEVDEDGNAAKAGLKEDDVITEVDGKKVNSADEVAKIIRESRDKASVMFKLDRKGKTQNIEVKVPRKLKTADL